MAAKKEPAVQPAAASDKKKALETAMQQIEKMYGKGSIMRYGAESALNVEAIPTGSLSLDLALGIGGLPRGRIVEIYGPESSGKTTLALHVLAEAQKMGGEVAFVDAEHALDPTYAKALGVNVEDMLISQPDTGEQALEITEALVRSGAIDVVVVDSVAALVPRAEIEGEMGDSFVGLHARLMSQALRKLTGVIAKTNSIVIFFAKVTYYGSLASLYINDASLTVFLLLCGGTINYSPLTVIRGCECNSIVSKLLVQELRLSSSCLSIG